MTSIVTNSRERNRFYRFAIVGTIGAIVDFGVMNVLFNLFHFQFIWAGTISFLVAILNNFTLNRYWTYPDSRSKPILRQLIEFSIVSLTGLVIRLPILKFVEPVLVRFFNWLPFRLLANSPEALSANLTLAIAIIIVLFWNFFVNRYWTYSDVT